MMVIFMVTDLSLITLSDYMDSFFVYIDVYWCSEIEESQGRG